MKRAVKLICFYHHIVTFAQNIVCAIVLGDTTEEGITVEMTLVHYMGTHSGCCGLAVSTRETKSLMGLGESAKHLCALLDFESTLTEKRQFLVFVGYRRSINHETRLLVATSMWNLVNVLLIVDKGTFQFQLPCEL